MKKQLARFVMLYNSELPKTLIMETTPPYFITQPLTIPKNDTESVEEIISDIANNRRIAVKIPGYTIFLFPWGSLLGTLLEPEDAKATLRDMADFFKAAHIGKNKHPNRRYEEGVPDDIDEQRGRFFKALKEKNKSID